jgi:prevent-host-death family protein
VARSIGVRELKASLADVLREVREQHAVYAVTHRGRIVARLVPEPPADDDFEARWSELDEIAAEIGREWPEGISAADAVSQDRREL